MTKKQTLARQMQAQSVNAGSGGQSIMALNPSTDPLVSHTQFAPVLEMPSNEEERRKLMSPGSDNKEW